jgi:proteic killer suppression protein
VAIDIRHVTLYTWFLIRTFADRHTKELYDTGKSKRFPSAIWKRALRKLEYLDLTMGVDDLRVPPSNRLHKFENDRKDQHSISANNQWRIAFGLWTVTLMTLR